MDAERILGPPSPVQLTMLETLTEHTEIFARKLPHLQASLSYGGSFVQTINPLGTSAGDPNGSGGQVITALHGAQPLVPKIIA